MNCQDRKNIPMGTDAETQQKIKDIITQKTKLAIHLLRECGASIEFCSSSQRIKLVFDHIDFTYEDEKLSLKADGREFIDNFKAINIHMAEDEYGKYPIIVPSFQPIRFAWRKKKNG